MTPSASPRVAVVGAGVLGLMSAWRLAQAGARVVLYEAAPERPNASAVAAGMIAPAAECALEPPLRDMAAVLRAARVVWTAIAPELGVPLSVEGSVFTGDAALVAARREALERGGFAVQAYPSGPSGDPAILAPGDALIAAGAALGALRAALSASGGVLQRGRVERDGDRLVVDAAFLEADVVVIATGAPGRSSRLAPELSRLVPLKGQLLRWRGAAAGEGPTLRLAEDVYVTRHGGEVTAGATVEPGRDDLEPQPSALARHRERAEALIPALRGLTPRVEVGVRADTPDGLPMVGPSSTPGVLLATGARRNGWLWAPPTADLIVAYALGRPLDALAPLAERLHPGRFITGEAT